MSLVRTVTGLLTLAAVAVGASGAPPEVHPLASPAPASAAEAAEVEQFWILPVVDDVDALAAAAAGAIPEQHDSAEPVGQGADTTGGGAMSDTPGMVNGTFPGLVWAVADVREVRAAVNAFRASRGLPSLSAPFGRCADRGVIMTPAFGIPEGTTHGKLLVKQNAQFLSGVPSAGGIMAADIAAAGDTDITGTFRPNSTVLLRLYECGASNSDTFFSQPPQDEPDPQPAPSPQPTPTPVPTPTPAPTAPAPTPAPPTTEPTTPVPAPTDPPPSSEPPTESPAA